MGILRTDWWSDEKINALTKLWLEGHSASEIAMRFCDGTTRCSVLGKVHRLGLPKRRAPSLSSPKAPKPMRIKKPPKHLFKAEPLSAQRELVIPHHQRKCIVTLERSMCRWPIGHVGEPEFHFCGGDRHEHLPYCEHHARRAYRQAGEQR